MYILFSYKRWNWYPCDFQIHAFVSQSLASSDVVGHLVVTVDLALIYKAHKGGALSIYMR